MENIMTQNIPDMASPKLGKTKILFSKDFFRSGQVQWVLIGALILNLANWLALAYFIRPVDFPITLHYNVYFGVDIIGPWWQAYFLPGIGLVIMAVNTTLGYFFYQQKDRIIGHILLLATCIIQVAVSIAVASLIMINY
jgi:hypothetical protein